MRAIMVMFDTLTRNFLPEYGNTEVYAPNFARLQEKCCTFDSFYAGSMPCMPARRELHTGKYNFLHRSWGPLEPFDHSCIETLRKHGIYTHLCTDHSHYWEDGGATYHNRYDTWEGFRGQEGDRWVPHDIRPENMPEHIHPLNKQNCVSSIQHYCNRSREMHQEEMPSVRTFTAGMEFLEHHADKENWFLQIEAFDPHEPFYVPQKFRKMYGLPEEETLYWPRYGEVPHDRDYHEDLENCRKEYAALLSMCDESLGRVLDFMDRHDMWKDTALIVNTDHGFLLGEHEYLGKNFPPCYEELTHLPFFLHVPGYEDGMRKQSLASSVDIAPTLLQIFGIHPEELGDIDGRSMIPVMDKDTSIRDHVIFGIHGGFTCWCDGHMAEIRCAADESLPFYEYTVMPTNIRGFFSPDQLKAAELVNPGRYSNDLPVMKIPGKGFYQSGRFGNMLFDLDHDAEEKNNLFDSMDHGQIDEKMRQALREAGAPEEEFRRIGLA